MYVTIIISVSVHQILLALPYIYIYINVYSEHPQGTHIVGSMGIIIFGEIYPLIYFAKTCQLAFVFSIVNQVHFIIISVIFYLC